MSATRPLSGGNPDITRIAPGQGRSTAGPSHYQTLRDAFEQEQSSEVTFTILIVTETWVAPIAGYLIDRFGPRVIVCGSGALVATAWIINSVADSLVLFYLAALIAGFGAGPIFAATVGNALKWFPDRRGLATGLTAAGFGAGSALTVVPLANMIQSSGYEAAYLWFGLGQGIVSPRGCRKASMTTLLRMCCGPFRSG